GCSGARRGASRCQAMSDLAPAAAGNGRPLAVLCGGGSLPYSVADAAIKQGRRVTLFALRGWADPRHWGRIAQFGRFRRLARAAGCRDVVMIGSLVRPSLSQLWPDFATLLL